MDNHSTERRLGSIAMAFYTSSVLDMMFMNGYVTTMIPAVDENSRELFQGFGGGW
jgi:hypothetical protein